MASVGSGLVTTHLSTPEIQIENNELLSVAEALDDLLDRPARLADGLALELRAEGGIKEAVLSSAKY